MPSYTRRLTWTDRNRPDDFTFLVDGKPAGRCYLEHGGAVAAHLWRWVLHVPPYGGGWAKTLEEAQQAFKTAIEGQGG